jgi:hypothetical protein
MDPRVDQFCAQDCDLPYDTTAQFLRSVEYRHEPEWKQGRYRSFKHTQNPNVLTLREFPSNQIIGDEARKVRNHVRRTFGVTEAESEKPND